MGNTRRVQVAHISMECAFSCSSPGIIGFDVNMCISGLIVFISGSILCDSNIENDYVI